MVSNQQKRADIEEWMIQFGTYLLRMNFLYLKDLQLAEDMVQETFLRAYLQYDKFRGDSSVKTWLTRISINLCKDHKKSSWFRKVDGIPTKTINDTVKTADGEINRIDVSALGVTVYGKGKEGVKELSVIMNDGSKMTAGSSSASSEETTYNIKFTMDENLNLDEVKTIVIDGEEIPMP